MKPASEAVLVPPRPNLGPEPLPGPSSIARLGPAIIVCSLILIALVRIRARRRPRAGVESRAGLLSADFATRREQMAAWSTAVRETLVLRFGPQWRARTTEEVASDATMSETLGADPSARLIEFLAAADRAKFDDEEGLQPPLPGVAAEWLVAFVASARDLPAAGARSRIKGR